MLRTHLPSLRFAAVFSQEPSAIDWACERAAQSWGPILRQSLDFDFNMTDYYTSSMGGGLKKRLIAFQSLVDPEELVASKHQAIHWEQKYRDGQPPGVPRPLNIDPGYLTEAKVVLMTTKDRDHRLYVGKGIYAEVTLFYQLPGKWVASRWTYPDYRMPEYHDFFSACRLDLRAGLQQPTRPS